MRMLLFYILFVAFGGQQIESPSHQVSKSPSRDNQNNSMTWRLIDSVTYYESQIRLADSLYKNYLSQYNFDEVKKAVVFFEKLPSLQVSESPSRDDSNNSVTWRLSDSVTQYLGDSVTQRLGDSVTQYLGDSMTQRLSDSVTQYLGDSVTQRLGDLNFLHAKAHYYHAVGLTERDDVVGACEHYLRALEIMEFELETENLKTPKLQNFRTSKLQNLGDSMTQRLGDLNYEKIRFLALIYNRLGRLFYNENYCELAITKYRKALRYFEILDDNNSKANVLKELGNSYQLANKPDSALYYYNGSLRYNSSLPNKLDVEKSIAKILFYQGDKDTAYSLIRDNLNMLDNENVRYSYYATLGKMYQEDEIYDSAIYYLEKSIESTVYYTRVTSAMQLSAIFDSLDNYEKQAYYDTFVSKMSVVNFNKGVESTQLHTLYIDYCNKKEERERLESRNNNIIIILLVILLIFMIIVFIFAIFQNRHNKISSILKDKELLIGQIDNEIKIKEKHISDLEFKQKLNDGKIRKKNNEIKEKDELLIKYRRELNDLKNKLERLQSECSDLNKFLQSEICSSILNNIDDLNKKNIDSSELVKLKQEQFILLLRSANIYLNNLIDDISNQYQKLKNDDLYYLCLIILGLNDKQISSLFGVTYNTIKIRKRKICSILSINNDDLHSFLIGKI